MNRLTRNSPAGDLALLLALSLIIKGIGVYFLPAVNPDGIRYINAAREFLEGDFHLGLSYIGNLAAYPLLLAGARQITPDWVLAGQLLSVAGFTLAAVPVYLITRDLFGRPAAIWSGLAFVLSPVINEYAAEVLREPLSVGLLLWAAWFGHRSLRKGRPATVLAASTLALLATFFRVESILFLPAFFALLLFPGACPAAGKKWLHAGLAVVPWVLVLFLLLGGGGLDAVVAGESGIGMLAAEVRSGNLLGFYPEVYDAFKAFEGTLPNANWSNDAAEIARHYLPLLYLVGLIEVLLASLYPPFFLLALVGLLRPPPQAAAGRLLLLLVAVFSLGAYFTLLHRNFISPRYLLAPAVFLLPWVGAGLESLRLSLLDANRRRLFPLVCLPFLLLPSFQLTEQWREEGRVLRTAGQWLKESNELENIRLICNDERVPFYAGLWRTSYAVPPPGVEDLAGFALNEKADFIVLQSSAKSALAPPPVNFGLLQEFSDSKNRVAIYRRHQ